MRNERRSDLVAAAMMPALPRRAGEVQPAAFARGDCTAGCEAVPLGHLSGVWAREQHRRRILHLDLAPGGPIMDPGVHMNAENGRRIARRSGPTSEMGLKATGLDRRAGLDAGE
jgi:hypothetical protein